jgi:uncharacterized protein (TIGR02266 family)
MSTAPPMAQLLPLLREFGQLDKARSREGLTPLQYQRWLDLKRTLAKHVEPGAGPEGIERRNHLRLPMRLLVEYRSRDSLRSAMITNLSRGGVFINTAFAPEIGARFTLCLRIDETQEAVDVPCEVVSHNVGDGFSTQTLGMGLKFGRLDAAQQATVDDLFDLAVTQNAKGDD